MQSIIRFVGLILSALVLSAAARAETSDCTEITALPYVVAGPGVYCLKHSLSGIGGIWVNTDDVTIDLNGHTLVSSALGVANYSGYKNIVVRNGTIRAATRAIYLTGTAGNVVERIRAEGSSIFIAGDGSAVRNSVVAGTTSSNVGPNYGIEIGSGIGIRVSDNVVVNPGLEYAGEAGGIRVLGAVGATIERNLISSSETKSFMRYGINLHFSDGAKVAGNHVVNMRVAISDSGGASLFLDNTVHGAVTPFSGGTMAGTTNYSF